jgi:hypothetical protein
MVPKTLQSDFDFKVFGSVLLGTLLVAIGLGFCAPPLIPYLVLLIFILFVLSRPEYVYFLFICLLPIHCFFTLHNNDIYRHINISDIVLVCIFVSWVVSRLAGTAIPYRGTSCDWPWFFFLFWVVLSLSWTPNLWQGYYEVIKVSGCIFAFIVTVSLLNNGERLKYALYIFIAIGVLTALVAAVSFYFSYGFKEVITVWNHLAINNFFWSDALHPLRFFFKMRGQALSVPHTTALYINVAFFFALGFLLVENSKKGVILWTIALAILMIGMLSTLTKSALGSLWVGMAFFFAHVTRLRNWFVTCLAVMIAVTILLFIVARAPEIVGSVKYTQEQMDQNASGSSLGERMVLWKLGLKKLESNYGLGYGAGGFLRFGTNPVPDGTHPAVLFDYGIIGFFLWCFIFGNAFFEFYSHLKTIVSEYYRRMYLAYLSGYVMMLIIWTVTLHYDYVDLYVYLGIGYALIWISQHETFVQECLMFNHKSKSLVRVPFENHRK